jgi:hypothetical protein
LSNHNTEGSSEPLISIIKGELRTMLKSKQKNAGDLWNTSVKIFDKSIEILWSSRAKKTSHLGGGIRNSQRDDEKKQSNQKRSTRRACSMIRQLIIENNMRYMWTLTYNGEIGDATVAKKDFRKYLQKLKYLLKEKPSYLMVMGYQEERYRKHGVKVIHFHFVTNSILPYKTVAEAWEKGIAHVSPALSEGKVANYLAKHLKSSFNNDLLKGGKKYFCSQGLKRPLKKKLLISEDELQLILSDVQVHRKKYYGENTWLQFNEPEQCEKVKKLLFEDL